METNGRMKKHLKSGLFGLGIMMAVLSLFQDPVYAKMIRGEVVAVKDDGSSFSVKRFDPSHPSTREQYDILMRADTKFEKISGLKELALGDEVAVDIVPKKAGKLWEANSVRIFKVRLYQTDAAQKADPD